MENGEQNRNALQVLRDQTRAVVSLVSTGITPILKASGLPPERFIRIVQNAMMKNDKLRSADPMSIVYACMTAAQLGIEPDGSTGEGYLIPYAGKCQFVPGYKGILKLARNSGILDYVGCDSVAGPDEFSFERGAHPNLIHRPALTTPRPKTREELRAVYAVAILKGSSVPEFVVLSPDDIDAVRDRTQAWRAALKIAKERGVPVSTIDTPWSTNYVAMGMKTALKRVCNLLPLSATPKGIDLARALDLDTRAERGGDGGTPTIVHLTPLAEEPVVLPAEEIQPEIPKGDTRRTRIVRSELDSFAGPVSQPEPEPEPEPQEERPSGICEPAYIKSILDTATANGWKIQQIIAFAKDHLGIDDLDALPVTRADQALLAFSGPPPAPPTRRRNQ